MPPGFGYGRRHDAPLEQVGVNGESEVCQKSPYPGSVRHGLPDLRVATGISPCSPDWMVSSPATAPAQG
jgi:hypothetical protein